MTKEKEPQNKKPKGLILADTSSIEQEGKWFEIPNHEPSQLKLILTKRKDWRKATKNWTIKKFDRKTHQSYEEIDHDKAAEEMEKILKKAVIDWNYIYMRKEDGQIENLSFNEENFDWFLDKFINLKVGTKWDENGNKVDITIDEWIMDISTGPENFLENDTENL
jgi:hypothetical protein